MGLSYPLGRDIKMPSPLSDGDQMLLDAFQTVADSHGRIMTVLSDSSADNVSETFAAVLNPAQTVDPTMDLGADAREIDTMEVRKDIDLGLEWGAIITDAGGAKWKVIRRQAYDSSICVTYWLQAIIPDKDS